MGSSLIKEEYQILYMCDDTLGLMDLMMQVLNLPESRLIIILKGLIERGLIEEDPMGGHGRGRWHYTTQLGKNALAAYEQKESRERTFTAFA